MRYTISHINSTTKEVLHATAANSLKMANHSFDLFCNTLQPGEAVGLVDTKTDRLISHRYQPTEAERATEAEEDLTRWIDNTIEDAVKVLEKFTDRLHQIVLSEDGDPSSFLSWSHSAFHAGAHLFVARKIRLLRGKLNRLLLLEHAKDQVLRRAKFPTHSTSQVTNLVEEAVTKAWAEAVDKLQFLVSWVEKG